MIWEYIKSCTLKMGLLTLLFNLCYNGCGVGANIWLAKWSSDEDEEAGNMSLSTSVKLLTIQIIQCSICKNNCTMIFVVGVNILEFMLCLGLAKSVLW